MGFLAGFMTEIFVAIALFGFLAWRLCSRSNGVAVAKFIGGIAQALASVDKAKSPTGGEP